MDIAKLLDTLAPQLAKIQADLIAAAQGGTFLQRIGLLYDAVLQVMLLAEQIQGAVGVDKKAFVIAAVQALYAKFGPLIPYYSVWSWFIPQAAVNVAIAAIVEQVYDRLFSKFVLQAKAPALS